MTWWMWLGLIALGVAAVTFPLWGPYAVMDDDWPGDER